MDKYTWRQVKALSSSSHRPSPRWGHSCCVVGEDIVFFGGYADSNYMNDLWAFNSITMKWRQIETTGDIPTQRSNCSMNYDKENNQIVIFGGGGANKQRFNSISILNWESKEWMEINPKQNQVAPWQRTYHVAEMFFPYLVVFGGEGVADMDDLWIFNFHTLGWTQVKIPNERVKPCARRFHSSVRMGDQFIILAGCHGKYRCLSDVFSMDMSSLLKTNKIQELQWKQKKLKNSSFLTRWGHSSSVYDNKIYIFGGRFSNDLNDLLVADFQLSTIKAIKITHEAPAARRRHCAGFIGSSMVIFGGFNGQYFNDLHYISVHQSRPKYQITAMFDEKPVLKYLNNKQYADYCIKSQQQQNFFINIGMISRYFQNDTQLNEFLQSVQFEYSMKQLDGIFSVLYCGYGDLLLSEQYKSMMKYPIFQTKNEKINYEKELIQKSSIQDWEKKLIKKSLQTLSPIVKLNEQTFADYFIDIKTKDLYDFYLFVGANKFPVNKIKLMAKSEYFANLFSAQQFYGQKINLIDVLGQEQNKMIYEIFFNFMNLEWLVLPDNVSADTYLQLIVLGDYFCIPSLSQLCCNEIITMLTAQNVQKILMHSIMMKITNLSRACCDFWIKKATELIKFPEIKLQIKKMYESNKKIQNALQSMLFRIGFDLAQVMMETERNLPALSKKSLSSNANMEKENYETNVYNH